MASKKDKLIRMARNAGLSIEGTISQLEQRLLRAKQAKERVEKEKLAQERLAQDKEREAREKAAQEKAKEAQIPKTPLQVSQVTPVSPKKVLESSIITKPETPVESKAEPQAVEKPSAEPPKPEKAPEPVAEKAGPPEVIPSPEVEDLVTVMATKSTVKFVGRPYALEAGKPFTAPSHVIEALKRAGVVK